MIALQLIFCVLVAASAQRAPDCGIRDIRELSVDGETVKSEQPWLIVTYKRSNGTSSDWSYWSTGTLISTTHVVIGALGAIYRNGTVLPTSLLSLVAGKQLEDYDVTEANTQTRDVTSVHIHDELAISSVYNNIALLVADRPFALTWNVNVACVDWNLQAPTPGEHVIAGARRYSVNSTSLAFTVEPRVVVAHNECLSSEFEEKGPLLSPDNICVRTAPQGACFSMHGAGLMVQRLTTRGARFYLAGVARRRLEFVMTSTLDVPTCFLYNVLTSYTSMSSEASWLRSIVDFKPRVVSVFEVFKTVDLSRIPGYNMTDGN